MTTRAALPRSSLSGTSPLTSAGAADKTVAPVLSEGIVDLIIDKDGKHLTPSEAAILRALVAAKGRTLSHEFLIGQAKATDESTTEAVLRTHICRIRRKCPDVRIVAKWGFGYALEKSNG